ncbi:MAG: DUF4381 domain-containing protein [Xanthomonadaceae bacterium]|nr:DUF4381 domain-containing protein [Xanthomonadaceae bacterium]
MSAPNDLVLRDIHTPGAPSWWPPAPGWWLALAVVLVIVALALWWRARRRRRREAMFRVFDETIAAAVGAPAQIAAMSELLRRASRRRDPKADRLTGDAWLRFLDDSGRRTTFSAGPGRLLLDGGFRREVPTQELAALRAVARERFAQLMGTRG